MNIKKALVYLPLAILALFICLPGVVVKAGEIKMNKYSFTFDKKNNPQAIQMWALDDDIEFTNVDCDKPSVALVEIEKDDKSVLSVEPLAIGTCKVYVTDSHNDTATITITVTKSYFLEYLKLWTELRYFGYGSKKAVIVSLPGTSGSLKIGKENVKFKVNSKGKAKIRIKKLYKKNTKYTLTIKNSKLSGKPSYKDKRKLDSLTGYTTAQSKGKYIYLGVYNMHKGDIVKIRFKGKTFTKKIKKNYSYKEKYVKFKVHKKVPYNEAVFTMKITNKYKQTLEKAKIFLYHGSSDYEDEEDDE